MITSFTSVGNLTSATIAAITITAIATTTTTTHTVTNMRIQYAGASSLSCMQASNF